jgi:hypothetical protein
MFLTCDHCTEETDEYETVAEAMEFGWWIVRGPERYLGGNGERVYCSKECLGSDLL